MGALGRRIVAGVGANAATQASTVFMQLAALPLFLRYWDLGRYGQWLMLSAVPSYLAMADAGMVTAAANRMTMAMARGSVDAARATFHSACAFVTGTGAAVLVVTVAVLVLAPGAARQVDSRLALGMLVAGVLVSLYGGLAESVFRATGRYARGTHYANVVRLAEWGGGIVGLAWHGSFAAVALGSLVARAAGTAVMMSACARGGHGLAWGWRAARLAEVRRLFRPALSFLAFPVSNALSLQGMTLLTGAMLGPAVVAVFNAYRTLARVAVQAASVFAHALWPEFSSRYGAGGMAAVAPLFRRTLLVSIGVALGLIVPLYVVAPLLLRVWSDGAIGFHATSLALMLGYALVSALWHAPRILLLAIDGHGPLALWSLATCGGMLVLGAAFMPRWGLEGAAGAMLLAEAALALACVVLVVRALRQPAAAPVPGMLVSEP